MIITVTTISLILIAYLIGSIPTAVWIGRYFYNIDVRDYGSGNSGATNTFRVLGKKAGLPVLLIDMLKGFSAVNLTLIYNTIDLSINQVMGLHVLFGGAVLLGHIFPVFAGFRGGKGIATLFGVVLAVHPLSAAFALAVFAVVFLLSRYVSLGSMLAALSFPVSVLFIFPSHASALWLFSFLTPVVVLITHQKNIERLINREENKTQLKRKTDDPSEGSE